MFHHIAPEILADWLPQRPRDSHKSDFGNVGILGGATGMAGAALLAGRAALMLGAGRVYVGLLDNRMAVDPVAPEMMLALPEQILTLGAPGCLVVGPGLSLCSAARGWLIPALASKLPLLLDADALNWIASEPFLADQLRNRTAPTLLTPHPGEAGRLLGCSGADIQTDREAALQRLVEDYRTGVVLKGADSLIGFPGRQPWHNNTGNPGMAAPGMGDILAGMIGALVAQGLEIERAAVLGTYLHGMAGDQAVRRGIGPVGLTATEIIQYARSLLNQLIYGVP